MSFFNKLFGKNKLQEINYSERLSIEQMMQTNYVQDFIKRYSKPAILLRPHKSLIPLNYSASKFGGTPNLNGFDVFPHCDACDAPLNFVLQLYKRDFPGHYFAPETNLFQLFRCPNPDCAEAYSEPFYADHKMFVFYFNDNNRENKYLTKPKSDEDNYEAEIPDCFLKPTSINDHPNYDDIEDADALTLQKNYGEDFVDHISDNYLALSGTKIGGYPSFTQSPNYPICKCGKEKEFFFQLSSEDVEDGVAYPPQPDNWSPHGIMIGDLGNIYFFVCKTCGSKTIESNWDCS